MVKFQVNAWCDEVAMEYWIRNCWSPIVKEESILVLDLHRAQKTDRIKDVLTRQCVISPVFVPAGCTSIVQPLDVSFNAPFKKRVENAAMTQMQENIYGCLLEECTCREPLVHTQTFCDQLRYKSK